MIFTSACHGAACTCHSVCMLAMLGLCPTSSPYRACCRVHWQLIWRRQHWRLNRLWLHWLWRNRGWQHHRWWIRCGLLAVAGALCTPIHGGSNHIAWQHMSVFTRTCGCMVVLIGCEILASRARPASASPTCTRCGHACQPRAIPASPVTRAAGLPAPALAPAPAHHEILHALLPWVGPDAGHGAHAGIAQPGSGAGGGNTWTGGSGTSTGGWKGDPLFAGEHGSRPWSCCVMGSCGKSRAWPVLPSALGPVCILKCFADRARQSPCNTPHTAVTWLLCQVTAARRAMPRIDAGCHDWTPTAQPYRPCWCRSDTVSGCTGFDGSAFFFTGVPNKTYNILSTEVRPGCVVSQHAAVSRASSLEQHAD